MHHAFIDKFSRGTTLIHRLDPRAKALFFFPLVVLINLTPIGLVPIFAGYACLLVGLALAARVPLGYLAKRLLLVLPFVLVIILFVPFLTEGEVAGRVRFWGLEFSVTWQGLRIAVNVLTKALLCALTLLVLVTTTRFDHLLRALEDLYVPRVILLILSFLYRYLFLLIEEAQQMKRARDARSVTRRRLQLKAAGGMAGVLFLRTYERAERVYQAMLARGFDGEVRTLRPLRFRAADLAGLAGGWALVAVLWGVAWTLR